MNTSESFYVMFYIFSEPNPIHKDKSERVKQQSDDGTQQEK